jgi:hypothetical protein
MPKNYKEVNIGSRTVLLKSAYTYGGQILTVTASAPSNVYYNLGTISENPTYVEVKASSSDGNGEGAILTLEFNGENPYIARQNFTSFGNNPVGSGYTPGSFELTSSNSTNGSQGSGAIAYFYDNGVVYNIDTVTSNANGYAVGDRFQVPGGNGITIVEIISISPVYYYSDWVFTSASPYLQLSNSDLIYTGYYNYNIGENLIIDMSEVGQENAGKDIQATVTSIYPDRNYGSSFNHQILYDRYDRKVYTRIINDDGTVENVDFNGVAYTPTELPDRTEFIDFERVSSTELLFTYNNAPGVIVSVSATYDEGGLFPVQLTIGNTSIYQTSLRVITLDEIEYDVTYTFNLEFTDVLGVTIQDSVEVTIPDPGGTGDNWAYPNYIEWTGSPYFLNESYHVALYKKSELTSFGIPEGGGIISRIGLPFHLTSGGAGNVTQEVLNGGFVVAATVITANIETISNTWIQNNLISGGQFDTSILDINSQRRSGIVEIVNGERYVFFQIENYTWTGEDNIVVIYWMSGGGATNGGYNGGYITKSMDGSEEVLGFSSTTEWVGSEGVVGEKASIAFTTLRG